MFAALLVLFLLCGNKKVGGRGEEVFHFQNGKPALLDFSEQSFLAEKANIRHLACAATDEFGSGRLGEVPSQTVGGGQENSAGFEQFLDAIHDFLEIIHIEQNVECHYGVKTAFGEGGVKEIGLGDFHIFMAECFHLVRGTGDHLIRDIDGADRGYVWCNGGGYDAGAAGELQHFVVGAQILQTVFGSATIGLFIHGADLSIVVECAEIPKCQRRIHKTGLP